MSGLPAVAGASEPPSKPDPGNPITEQNLLYNIKSFAADAAYSDDRARSLAQVMLIMETQEEDKARKSLAEAARDKVSAAVFNFKRANEKPRLEAKSAVEKGRLPTTADKKAHEAAAAADEFQTLEELLMERRLLMRLGCFEEAHVYEKRIEAARERREKKRVEMNKHVLEKKLAGLEMKQRVQRQQFMRKQAEESSTATEAAEHEIKELITLQAQEYHELFEAVTKAAAFEENAQMDATSGGRSALRTLAKQRYRMSKDLLSMKDSQAKLLEVGRDMQAKEMAEGARKKEFDEKSTWREGFLTFALGSHDGSILSQMLATHKSSQAKVKEKNERALVALKRDQARTRTRQEGTFRLEKFKVIDLCRVQGTAMFIAGRDDDGAQLGDDWKKKNMKVVEDDLEHGGVGQVIAARDDGTVWVAPVAFGLDNSDAIEYRDTLTVQDGAAELNSLSAEDPMFRNLTKLYWFSEPVPTLVAIVNNTDGLRYFSDYVSDDAPAFEIDLRFVNDVAALKKMAVDEQYNVASELYYQKNGLSDGLTIEIAMKFLNGESRRLVQKLAAGCFEGFVKSDACEALLEEMGRKWYGFKDVPQLKDRPWAELFTTSLNKSHAPLIMVNVQVPGLPISWANEGFEILTGFNKAEAIGKNCRFMQGSDTQQDAISSLSRGICEAKRTDVRIYNYRKNGTRFLNHVTLHPIHDSDGVFRYCVALLGDAEAEALLEKDPRTIVDWLPKSFPNIAEKMGSLHGKRDDADDLDGKSSEFQKWENQFMRASVTLSKLALAYDAELRFPVLMGNQDVLGKFRDFCERTGHMRELDLWISHEKASGLSIDERASAARELLLANNHSVSRGGSDTAREIEESSVLARNTAAVLSNEVFTEWLKTPESSGALVSQVTSIPRPLADYTCKLWHKYDPPPELVGWLSAFVHMAEKHPMSMVLSDMTIAGNPMIFVNKVFCTVSQYSPEEALGRNCRFLQGPETEPQAVSQIQHALRQGEHIYVKITNYRRSGQKFLNLLALRPVYDSNALLRLCVGIQCEVSQSVGIEKNLKKLAAMAVLAPARIDIGKVKAPSVFAEYLRNKDRTKHRGDNMAEADTNLMVTDRLRRVLNTAGDISEGAGDIQSSVRYAANHLAMLKEFALDGLSGPESRLAARAHDYTQLETALTRVLWIGHAESLLEKLLPLKSAYDELVKFYRKSEPTGAALLNLEFLLEVSTMQLMSDIRARRRAVGLIKLARKAVRGPKLKPGAKPPSDGKGGGSKPKGGKSKPPKPQKPPKKQKDSDSDSGSGLDSESGSDSDKSSSDSDKSGSDSEMSSKSGSDSDKMSDVDKPAAPAGGAAEESDEDDGPEVTDSAEALAEVMQKHRLILRKMASEQFPHFVMSDAGTALISRAVREVHQARDNQLTDEERGSLSDLPIAEAKAFPSALVDTLGTAELGIILVDMYIPGLPIVWANEAFEQVTGYTPEEARGQNCRFLQGPKTEPEKVIEIVEAVREGAKRTVTLTNYKKSGAPFTCECLIHPVHDQTGRYVYCIGVLVDGSGGQKKGKGSDSDSDNDEETEAQHESPLQLRDFLASVLPSVVPARFAHPWEEDNPPPNPVPLPSEQVAVQRHACNTKTNAEIIRMAWLTEGRSFEALCALTENPTAYAMLKKYMQSALPVRAPALKLFDIFDINIEVASSLRKSDFAGALSSVKDLAELHRDGDFDDVIDDEGSRLAAKTPKANAKGRKFTPATRQVAQTESADELRGGIWDHPDMELCQDLLLRARRALAKVDVLPKFFRTSEFDLAVQALHRPDNLGSSKLLLWGAYELPSDAFAFIHGLTAAAQSYPFSLTITDQTLAGNPLIYVNQKFCELTGYAMGEMLGFNCRFLQGPRTEPKCVEAIQMAIRRAIPCLVRVTNYRKDGTFFNQLLALQPVHDSQGRFRFCIGVQAPVLPGQRSWVETYVIALSLLPFSLHSSPFEAPPSSSVRCKAYFESELTFALLESQQPEGRRSETKIMEERSSSEDSDAFLNSDSDADSDAPPKPKVKAPKFAVPTFSTIEEPLQPFGERSIRTITAQLSRLISGPPGGVVIAPADKPQRQLVYSKEMFESNHEHHTEELKGMVKDIEEQAKKQRAHKLALLERKRKGSAKSYPSRKQETDEAEVPDGVDGANVEALRLTQLSWIDSTGECLGTLVGAVDELKDALVSFGSSVRKIGEGETAREEPRLDGDSIVLALDILAASVLTEQETLMEMVEMLEGKMKNEWPEDMGPAGDEEDDMTRLRAIRAGFCAQLKILLFSIWPAFVVSEDGVELVGKLASEALVPPSRRMLLGFSTTMLGQPWMVAFMEAVTNLPVAASVVDMGVAGLPMVFVNQAFEDLTGYTMIDSVGNNCRFLQKGGPDDDAIAALSLSIRSHTKTRQVLVNYRKGGRRFLNGLTLVYIKSASGEARYCVGLQVDEAEIERSPEIRDLVDRVVGLLPEKLRMTKEDEAAGWAGVDADTIQGEGAWSAPARRRPVDTVHKVHRISDEMMTRQYARAVGAFTKLEWLIKPDVSFKLAMQEAAFCDLFDLYLKVHAGKRTDELRAKWRICREAPRLQTLSSPLDTELAESLYRECIFPFDSSFTPNPKYRVLLEATTMLAEFAGKHFLPFLQTDESDAVFSNLGLPVSLDAASQLLWSDYKVPDELKLWLLGFASAAWTLESSIVISDMSLPGNPLVFVNESFCVSTGFTKEECLGLNCRFLQGPETEAEGVHQIVQSLQNATDLCVKLTNYRRSGETFQNLLALRPVHDTNGAYRLCIGVQSEVIPGVDNARIVDLLARVICMLPSLIDVDAAGGHSMHNSWLAEKSKAERSMGFGSFDELKASLLDKVRSEPAWKSISAKEASISTVSAPAPGLATSAPPNAVSVLRYDANHGAMVHSLGVRDVADQFSRIRFLHNPRAILRVLLRMTDGCKSFLVYVLRQVGPRGAVLIDTITELWKLANADRYIVRIKCAELYERLHGRSIDPLEAQEMLEGETELALLKYASEHYPQWVTSGFGETMLHQLRTVRNSKVELPLLRASYSYLKMVDLALGPLSLAALVVDMRVAGLPIHWTNAAFTWLTGYSGLEAVGKNCRFLQGDDTEMEAVATLVEAIRDCRSVTVTLTNYRKDGSPFRNELTLLPLHDSEGVCRFLLGLLRDTAAPDDHLAPPEVPGLTTAQSSVGAYGSRAAMSARAPRGGRGGGRGAGRAVEEDENSELAQLRKKPALTQSQLRGLVSALVDRTFPSHLQPAGWPTGKLMEPSDDASLEQARAVQVAFTKLDWLELPEKHFRESVVARDELRPFETFLKARNLETTLKFWMAASKLMAMSELARMAKLDEAYKEFLETSHSGLDAAPVDNKMKLEAVVTAFKRITRELVDVHFVDFIYSEKSDATVTRLMEDPTEMDEGAALLWKTYPVPGDCTRFISKFTLLFDKYPACICLSDMTMPGSPMIFVNQGFSAITGYRPHEVLGKSCRFLQGQLTDPEAVAAIMRSLRAGTDCHVKIANYTKGGTPFKSLLTLLAIFDSNGVYRFCMGIQFPITEQVTIRRRFMRLSRLVCLLPRMLEVGSAKPVAPMHPRALRLVSEDKEAQDAKVKKAAMLAAIGADAEDEADGEEEEEEESEEEEVAGAPAAEGEDGGEVGAPAADKPKEKRIVIDKERWAGKGLQFGLPGTVKAELARDVSREESAHRLSAALMATRDDIGTIIDADGAKTKVRSEAAPRVFRDNLFAFLKEIGAPRPENSGAMMRGPIEGIDDNEGNAFDAVKPLEGFGSQELYSKLMWMRNATPEMLLRLLKFAPAMANFKQYVRTVSHVSIEVIFYLEVVKLEEPMCSEDEQEIMAVFRRFLPAQRAPNGTAAYKILKDQASVTLAMLAQEFLVDFVKSTAFVNTFMQLRGIRELRGTTEAQELFLELPAKGDWQLPHVPTSRQLTLLNREDEWVRIFHICLDNHELAIILVNMQLPGLPIVFANKAFATLTGYSQAEVLGQNCSFLQGQGTEPQSVRDVKGATQEFRSGVRIEMLNYRNNGESFKNLLSLGFTREYPGGPAKYAVGILVERMQGKGTLVTQSQLRKAQELISVLPRATRTTRAAPPPSAAERIKRSEGPGSDGQGTTAEVLEKTTLQEFNPEKWLDGAMKTMDSLLRCLPEGRDVFSEFMLNQYYEQAFAKGSTVPKGKRGGMALGGMGGSATARGGLGQSMVSLGRSSVGGMGGANRASSAAMRQPASSRAVLSVNDMKGTSSRSLAITTPTGVSGVSGGGSGATPAAMMMAMDVRLSLHGANYFRERAVYGETILGFWLAIDTLKSLSGETLRSKAAECFRIFGAPEVGSKHNMRTADSFKRAKAAPSEMDESEADTQSFRVARGVSPSRQAASAHKPSMADDMADDEALVRSSSGSTLDSGVSVGELQRVMHSTMQLLAFDLLPAFLRSRLLTGLASSLMQTSKDPELELSIRVSRSTAPQDADDWMALFCAVAERLRTCVIVCDMIKPGVPIMYVNKAFEQMTEYTREEAVGRNCRFLQGKQTDATTVAQIAYAIRNGRPISCKLVNYRKSGQPFLNLISLQPICDRDGLYRFMLGTNCEISDKYTQMTKTRLMHMDRLIKLLPTVLELPSSVETKARAELVRETVMEPVLRPYKVQRVGAPSSRQRASSKMLTSSAKTTAFGTPSSAFLSGGAAGARGRGGGCGCGALSEDEPTSQRGKAVGGFSGNRASVAVLSMGSPMRQSTVGASSAALPRPGSSAAPATGDPNMARAGRSSGDSEARAGKSILGFVKLNLRHNIGVDGAGDPIDASAVDDGEDEVVPRPPAGVPSMPNPMRTLGMMSQGMGSGGGRPGMLGTPGMPPGAGGVGRPPTMPPMTPPKPAAASPAKPGAAPPSKPAPRPPPGRSKAPEPPPKPVVEDKDAHLKKTAADVDMSALMGGSDDSDSDSFRSDDESKSESGSDAS